jgi:uncharacterized membrane protein
MNLSLKKRIAKEFLFLIGSIAVGTIIGLIIQATNIKYLGYWGGKEHYGSLYLSFNGFVENTVLITIVFTVALVFLIRMFLWSLRVLKTNESENGHN